jgi:hypothetical protein
MKMRSFYIFTALYLVSAGTVFAAMSSTNYRINIDSINSGGTDFSSSTNYRLHDTVGEVASGDSASPLYALRAGYRQMETSFISISSPPDINLPSMSGIIGGSSSGDAVWTVTTDNTAGYELTITSSTSPALQSSGGAFFQDYAPAGSVPDLDFTVAPSNSAFGFSVFGSHAISDFKHNGSVCDAGSTNAADKCWDGFSTTPRVISQGASSNHPSGTATTVTVRAEIGSSKIQDAGTYQAELTVTATVL